MPKLKPLDGLSVRGRSRPSSSRRKALGFWTWEARCDRVRADTVVASLFNVDPEAAEAGLPLNIFAAHIQATDRPRVLASFTAASSDDGPGGLEYRVRGNDGGLRLVLSRGRFSRDHRGCPLSGHGIIIDISDLQPPDADRAPSGTSGEGSPGTLLDRAAAGAIAAFQALGPLNDPGLTARAEALLFEIGRKLATQEVAEGRERLN